MLWFLLILAGFFWWLGTRAAMFGSKTPATLLRVGAAMMFMGPMALILIGLILGYTKQGESLLASLAWAAWGGQMIGGLMAAAGAFFFAVDALKR